jgi:hypothetical protein
MSSKIAIHRLTTGSTIIITDPAWGRTAYLVENIEFDGYGYTITYGDERGWTDTTYVDAGGSVDADGELRTEEDITADEWQALNDAIDASISDKEIQVLRNLGSIATMNGHVCQPIDESPLVEAVADALGVPAVAAE